ncbi:MAG TPA: 3-isopropylmalate dehydratase small subunit [Steroidobacteraceae bacterium]|nr:3-isopropylmalate dehydratase small subunit [Steroidobacteraceae bacterium]
MSAKLENLRGRAWVFGDNIDTDLLAPGHAMRKPLAELAQHCLEAIDPQFARSVHQGDFIVAGTGFGIGSSREQAAQALAHLGVGAVLAVAPARIFYRNAINLGLPVVRFPHADSVRPGDDLVVDLVHGCVYNLTRNTEHDCEPVPEFLRDVLQAGGLIPHLRTRLRRQ